MVRPFERTYTPSDVDADGYVDGGTGASLTLLASSAGDGLAHRLSFASAQDISDHTFTVVGTDADGVAQTEVVTGPNATTVESVKYFLNVTSITPDATLDSDEVDIGWADEFRAPTYVMDRTLSDFSVHANVSGTINYTLQQTLSLPNGASAQDLIFSECSFESGGGPTTSQTTSFDSPVAALSMRVNSYSSGATLTLQVIQAQN